MKKRQNFSNYKDFNCHIEEKNSDKTHTFTLI